MLIETNKCIFSFLLLLLYSKKERGKISQKSLKEFIKYLL